MGIVQLNEASTRDAPWPGSEGEGERGPDPPGGKLTDRQKRHRSNPGGEGGSSSESYVVGSKGCEGPAAGGMFTTSDGCRNLSTSILSRYKVDTPT